MEKVLHSKYTHTLKIKIKANNKKLLEDKARPRDILDIRLDGDGGGLPDAVEVVGRSRVRGLLCLPLLLTVDARCCMGTLLLILLQLLVVTVE